MLTDDFLQFSAHIGADPMQIQGPGGNTSIKTDHVMWIKASGKELSNALDEDIFVAVDHHKIKAQLRDKMVSEIDSVISSSSPLRPSIETSFHAAFDWKVVAHTHSIATLIHMISVEGRNSAMQKLSSLHPVLVPYCKPGLDLTHAILERIQADTRIVLLENHGLICCDESVEKVAILMQEVEERLAMPVRFQATSVPTSDPENGYQWVEEVSVLAQHPSLCHLITQGSYYPDHVVFLGCALGTKCDTRVPAFIVPGVGVQIKCDATASQRAMLKCLSDVFSRHPKDWHTQAIGIKAEAELMNWEAEKYRQKLAKSTA